MADITKIQVGTTAYNVKDDTSRTRGNTMLKYTSQSLTAAQQTQARTNIGIQKVGTLAYEYVTTVIVLCSTGTSVTLSKVGSTSQTATSVNNKCTFLLPSNDDTVGVWDVSGVKDSSTATTDVDITRLGNTYTVNLEVEFDASEIYVTCPLGSVSLTFVSPDGNDVYNFTTSAGYYELAVRATGVWTVVMSAPDHLEVTGTVNVAVLGVSYNLDLGEWPPTTITVTHPVGADLTCKTGTYSSYDYTLVNSTTTRFTSIDRTGTWTITATDLDLFHQPMSGSVTVSTLGSSYTVSSIPTTWTTVLIEVTHPTGATVTCTKSGTSITGTTSGYTSKFYVTSTGNWTITVTRANQKDMTRTVNVTNMNANGYYADFDTTWPPAVLYVTHPAEADVTCTVANNSVYGDYVSSTVTAFEITTAPQSWSVVIHDFDGYHQNVGRVYYVPTLGEEYTLELSWTDVLLYVTVPAGATVSVRNVDTNNSGTYLSAEGTTLAYYVGSGVWRCSANHTYHSTVYADTPNISTTHTSPYYITVNNELWADTLLTINHPSVANEANITMTSNGVSTDFSVVTSTDTQTVYSLKTVGKKYTFTYASKTSIHQTKSYAFTYDAHTDYWTPRTYTWVNVKLTITHPAGATTKLTSGSTVVSTEPSSSTATSTAYWVAAGTWTVEAYKSGHTKITGSKSVTAAQVTGNSGLTYSFGTSWKDSYIRVKWLKGADVAVTDGTRTWIHSTDGQLYDTLQSYAGSVVAPSLSICTVIATSGETVKSVDVTVSAYNTYYYGDGTTDTTLDTSKEKYDLLWDVPTAYQKCEYIESSGGGYLDTGFVFGNSCTISCTYAFNSHSGAIGGTYTSPTGNYEAMLSTFWLAFPGYGLNPNYSSSTPYTYNGTFEGSVASSSSTITLSRSSTYGKYATLFGYTMPTIYLFALHDITVTIDPNGVYGGGATFNASAKIYSFTFTGPNSDYSALEQHNFVPVYQKRDYDHQTLADATGVGFLDMYNRSLVTGTNLTAGPAVTET